MSEPTIRDDVHALLGAYILDALVDDERAAFDRHLEACADCRSELPGMRAAAARLGATAYVSPPERLRAAVMAEVRRTRQLPPVTEVSSLEERRRTRLGARLLSVAAALLLVVAGGLGVAATVQHRRAEDRAAQLAAIEQLITSPESRRTAIVPGGGTAVVSTAGSAALVEMSGVAAPPAGKTYELWLVPHSGDPRPAGLMPGGQGKAFVADTSDLRALAVTVEPSGGSKRPTTDPFLTVPV
ncbi:anti-sigma-K factor RskA [Motilibacter peucedani]|uniref:Regulator of SigK n=1 Tax=Motilibacter peucedani TaxID=598650 RepID=A0A420XRU4_9ACTN|nr:anti-sigma factor [Motilibacter peucedani]RKS77616.1 anti-sigma-K factor RskA [Motilibacter peucedani]